jgi:hypothetical protein
MSIPLLLVKFCQIEALDLLQSFGCEPPHDFVGRVVRLLYMLRFPCVAKDTAVQFRPARHGHRSLTPHTTPSNMHAKTIGLTC